MTDQKPLLTRAEIVALARQIADLDTADPLRNDMITLMVWELERFVDKVAERAAAAEREWLVEKAESSLNSLDETCSWAAAGYAQGIRDFVAAIRARGEA